MTKGEVTRSKCPENGLELTPWNTQDLLKRKKINKHVITGGLA